LLEDEPLTPREVDEFSKMVGTTMRIAVEQLHLSKLTEFLEKSKTRNADVPPSSTDE
jgi:hypothetical protein